MERRHSNCLINLLIKILSKKSSKINDSYHIIIKYSVINRTTALNIAATDVMIMSIKGTNT